MEAVSNAAFSIIIRDNGYRGNYIGEILIRAIWFRFFISLAFSTSINEPISRQILSILPFAIAFSFSEGKSFNIWMFIYFQSFDLLLCRSLVYFICNNSFLIQNIINNLIFYNIIIVYNLILIFFNNFIIYNLIFYNM